MYAKFTSCNFGQIYDIKLVDYFTAKMENIPTKEKLQKDVDEVCKHLRQVFEKEMTKKGYVISDVGDIAKLK